MIISFSLGTKQYKADLSKPLDISIPIDFGEDNPNCYWASPPLFETIIMGDFVGSVAQGGPVNYQKITLTPHGNGTHTECVGHITDIKKATIANIKAESHYPCAVMSLAPTHQDGDDIITFEAFKKKWKQEPVSAVVIRSLPNATSKLNRKYSGTNPPYLDSAIATFLNEQGVKHLITDLPSVDREEDEGKLLSHKAFFGVPDKIRNDATITELAFIPDDIKDGLYLLNLQTIRLNADASPSRPVLYEISSF